jgi:hypothetical protein
MRVASYYRLLVLQPAWGQVIHVMFPTLTLTALRALAVESYASKVNLRFRMLSLRQVYFGGIYYHSSSSLSKSKYSRKNIVERLDSRLVYGARILRISRFS